MATITLLLTEVITEVQCGTVPMFLKWVVWIIINKLKQIKSVQYSLADENCSIVHYTVWKPNWLQIKFSRSSTIICLWKSIVPVLNWFTVLHFCKTNVWCEQAKWVRSRKNSIQFPLYFIILSSTKMTISLEPYHQGKF